jgi:hypothetical protein
VNEMTMPGFSAEASLRETSGQYRTLSVAEDSRSRVVPAAPCCENCESSHYCIRCEETGAWAYCRYCYNCLRWCVPCRG